MDARLPVSDLPLASMAAIAWKGVRFGGKFTFWFLIVFVTLPITVNLGAKVASRPHRWQRILFNDQTAIKYVIPAVGAPIAGAAMGAAVAAVLFPLASLLDSRSSSGRWEGYEPSLSPFEDAPLAPRSREELLRRIVLHGPPDWAAPGEGM